MSEAVDYTLDVKGLNCPMPIVKLAQTIKDLDPGAVIRVVSSDESFIPDVEAWCRNTGQELLSTSESGDEYVALVKKVK
jgi:tRNA 2-thiouridine synthesizing protein A